MKRLFRFDVLLIVVVPLVDSLAVAVGAETGNFVGLVDIGGGRKMYLECSGGGSPSAVLVGGLRASADDWDISDKSKPTVFTEVGKFTRVCACDRLELRLVKSQAAAIQSRSQPQRRMQLPLCTHC
jgi:hypothetical protein